jgi:shikimate O-hydroxycinnamoyltransferase
MAVESNSKSIPIKMIWIYWNSLKMSKDKFMPSIQLQSTLSDTLNHFPILAGRITEDTNGNATIHLNNEGVSFTEAQCPDQTLDYFIKQTIDDEEFDYDNINTSDLDVAIANDSTGPIMSIQITRLQCGSIILSISASHCLMDAQSMANFINTWASGSKHPENRPMMDKAFILLSPEELLHNPISRPSDCTFNRNIDPLSVSPFTQPLQHRVISKVYYFSTNELNNIKEEAMKSLPSTVDYISTYDALFAHMILVIASATQTSFTEDKKIKIIQSFNGRPRFVASYSPAVLHYFGSFPFWLYNKVTTNESPTLSSLAQFIHEMYTKQTEKSLKYYNAYLSSDNGNIRKNQVDADIINRDFHCTSWRKVNMLGANFGGGDNYPIYNGPREHRYPRYFVMMDTNRRDGSINVLLGLREQDYQRMLEQNIIHEYR